jgi:hypothetical protein
MNLVTLIQDINMAARSEKAFDSVNAKMIADDYGFDPAYVQSLIDGERKNMQIEVRQ